MYIDKPNTNMGRPKNSVCQLIPTSNHSNLITDCGNEEVVFLASAIKEGRSRGRP